MKINIKTPDELKLMQKSGKILQLAQEAMKKEIREGVTTKTLDKIAEDIIRSHNAVPTFKGFHGFSATICANVNSEVVHGIPNDRKLKNGNIISVDCGAFYKNLCSDATFSVIVGGDNQNPKRAKFSNTVKDALKKACAVAKTGNYVGDIGYTIEKIIRKGGYSICKEYGGHGLGYEMHEDPFIFNYGKPGTGIRLVAGMTICIEPVIVAGKPQVKTLSDQWTVVTVDGYDGCQWEHCGVVTEKGLDIFA